MLDDIRPLDLIAFGTFVVIWMAYHTLIEGRLRRPQSINAQMSVLRERWMAHILAREMRMMDSMLIGHAIHSASFFASTTIIVMAGLVGVLGAADRVSQAIGNISVLLTHAQALLELKIILMIGVFVYAFFKFTWAIRQLNYFSAILGAAPVMPCGTADADAYGRRMSTVLTHAISEFNGGVRAYYFALAALGWFVHPIVFLAATVVVCIVLIRRQLYSPTADAIRDHVRQLPPLPSASSTGPGAVPESKQGR
jgi:uncharacterized membrane protein